jgi:hypothetical protein
VLTTACFDNVIAIFFDLSAIRLKTDLNQAILRQRGLDFIRNSQAEALLADVEMRFEPLADAAELFLFGASEWYAVFHADND